MTERERAYVRLQEATKRHLRLERRYMWSRGRTQERLFRELMEAKLEQEKSYQDYIEIHGI